MKKKPAFNGILIFICLAAAAYLLYQLYGAFAPRFDLSRLQNLVTVFLSILYEAFPFILIGILVSAFIQVLVPSGLLERIFTRNRFIGYLAALFAGVVFPVCDCATVPVAARLMKKGVPAPIAVTFLLAAPSVNPIVVASTLYAFPGNPSVAVYRLVFGLSVALLAGLLFNFVKADGPPVVLNKATVHDCVCILCGEEQHHEDEHRHGEEGSRFQAVFRHAAEEFFEVGVYLIVGALLSSAVQTYVPISVMTSLGGSIVLSLLAMMAAAFILSICSTSDAFIARTFANSLPIASVMGFLILGPMLDLKNLFLLLGNFKKSFVLKLVPTIVIIAFFVLMTFTISL